MPKPTDITKEFKTGTKKIVPRDAKTLMKNELCRYVAAKTVHMTSMFFFNHNILRLIQSVSDIQDEKMREALSEFLKGLEVQTWAFDRNFHRAHGEHLIQIKKFSETLQRRDTLS